MNSVSKRKVGAAGKGAFPETPNVAEATHGPGSPKLEGVAEAIVSSSTGVRRRAPEEPFQLCQSDDVGINTVSKCVRSSISHKSHLASTGELSGDAADLVLGPDSDLSKNGDHVVLCSSSNDARLARVSESPSALLHSQHTVNSCATRLGYDLASPLQLASSTSSFFSDSQPPSTCGSHPPQSSVQTRYFHATLGGFHSAGPTYPKCTAQDSRPASACIHPDSSIPTHVVSQPPLVPLPSIYWLLFDSDEHSIEGHNDTLRGSPLSPPGELGGSGVAVASQASATPVSFLARWEDLLTLERSVRSSFIKNLCQARQAQPPEVTLIEQDGLGASLMLRYIFSFELLGATVSGSYSHFDVKREQCPNLF